jgi:hypothetical protein
MHSITVCSLPNILRACNYFPTRQASQKLAKVKSHREATNKPGQVLQGRDKIKKALANLARAFLILSRPCKTVKRFYIVAYSTESLKRLVSFDKFHRLALC